MSILYEAQIQGIERAFVIADVATDKGQNVVAGTVNRDRLFCNLRLHFLGLLAVTIPALVKVVGSIPLLFWYGLAGIL